MRSRRSRPRLMSEINVVPYIDVMLVLLIIFMITAPLITQGVKIDLPQAPSEVLAPSHQEPVMVTVDARGDIYIDYGDKPKVALDEQNLLARVSGLLKYRPDIQFLVRGDRNVPYGRVITVMTLLQAAGVDSVGLVTEPPER
ncbi:MAG: protein TolR [Proteobacteria bacterium]|nr:MAG: protein TolR [Pseudomonadota bacterium]TDJ65344.1 MAG: protein TolR [Pseudomonadota bacterium]